MSSYEWPPSGSGGGVPIYANVAAFPVTATTGDLAVDASTGNLYEFNGVSWVIIAGPGFIAGAITNLTGDGTANGPGSVPLTLATVNAGVGSFGSATQVPSITVNAKGLVTAAANTSIQITESQVTNLVADLAAKQGTITIGALDAQAENANGLALVANVLSTQSADATHPGMVNAAASQILPGTVKFINRLGIGTATTPIGALLIDGQGVDDLQSPFAMRNGANANTLWDWYINPANGNITVYNPNQGTVGFTMLAAGGFNIGPFAPVYTFQVGAAESFTDTTIDQGVNQPDIAVYNSNATVNNYESYLFSNSSNAIIAKLVGVNENHSSAGSQSGHVEMHTRAAGVDKTAQKWNSNGTTTLPSLTTAGVVTTDSSGNISSIATTGTGVAVLATSPTLVTPVIGAATGTSLSVSGQLTSTVSTGTAPLVVTSTTQVANLNAATAGSSTTSTTATNLSGGAGGSVPYQSAANTTAMLANGTAGQVLTSAGTTLPPTWTSVSGATQGNELKNLGLALTASSNILTFALKQSDGSTDPAAGSGAVLIGVRSSTAATGSYFERSVTAALSQTLSAGTTLGMLASQNNYLWLYSIDSDGSGAMKLALSTTQYDEMSLQSTVVESFSATATNASPAVFTATAHGMPNGTGVRLTGTPPTGFTTGTTYFVVSTATNTFDLAATPGGTAINSSSTGSSIVIHIADGTLVSGAVYTSKAIRLVGRGQFNLSVTGNWVTPSELSISSLDPINGSVIGCEYNSTASSNVSVGSTYYFDFPTKESDTNGCVFGAGAGLVTTSGTGWRFIVPKAGRYQIDACAAVVTASPGTGFGPFLQIAINGTVKREGSKKSCLTTAATQVATISGAINLSVNDRIEIVFQEDLANVIPTGTNSYENWVSIYRVGS